MKNSVIVTGADGFVGSHTVKVFLDAGYKVLALDVGKDASRLVSHPLLQYEQCDISDVHRLKSIAGRDEYGYFIHFAWAGSSGEGRFDYNLQMRNAIDTIECMKAAKEIGCTRFVCAGSIMEYEVEAAVHARESRPGMGYIYGMGKHVAHCMCKSIAAEIGIDLLWPMITNAYGIGELSPRFVNTTLRKIIRNEPLQFTPATQNYDFVYVSDVAMAFFLVTTKGKPFCEYMIGSGNARPLREFVREMVDACCPACSLAFGGIPFSGVNMPLSTFSIESLVNDCGYAPKIKFGEGAKMTMDWLMQNDNR